MDIVLVVHFLLNMVMLGYQFMHTAFSMIRRFLRVQQIKAKKAAKDAEELSA